MKQLALWCLWVIASGIAAAQEHPAFALPAGFKTTASGDQERTFEQGVPNGDRLRLRVFLQPSASDPEAVAKGPALEEGDQLREDTRQEIKSGALSGVSYSVLGKSETIDGVAYTRYRRVMGLKIETNPVAFAARADILAREPRPAQSTLEAMARALTEWQSRIGGASKDPVPEPGADPASKPALGGDQVIRLSGGGDLEIQVPAFWGRADLKYGDGHEEILVGPARDIVSKVTAESLAKDKDRLGPYISIARIQKDTFNDLVDVQLLDIKESLLADYVARQADGGVTLTLHADRDEGTLGTRTVLSVPFDEKRASGTTHRGRSVFMMHKGSLVIVTASHPTEKFDEGWPDVARAFDTLLFTGADEPESAPATRRPPAPPADPTAGEPQGGSREPEPPPASDRPTAAPQPPPAVEPTPPSKLAPAPPEWTGEAREALKAVEIPVATPVSVSIPAGWSLLADADGTRPVQAFVATAKPDSPLDPLGSSLRIDYVAFREDLATPDGLARVAPLLRLRLEQDARALGHQLAVVSAQEVSLGGRTAHALQYTLKSGERTAAGTLAGAVLEGTVVVMDLRLGAADSDSIAPLSSGILASIRISAKEQLARREFGPYSMLVPEGWELSEQENAGGGRNVFVRAPSGVDVRFQTAAQAQMRQNVMELETLRRVTTGFLVEGLKVLSLADMAAARRFLPPGGGPGLRFHSSSPQMNVLALASQQGSHLVFALRGAPPQYYGRDLAVAWAVIQSFTVAGADRGPRADPVRIAGAAVARRVVFARTELDAVAPDGSIRPASTLFLALLPDGGASVVSSRNGRTESPRGSYRIEGGQVTVEGPGLGRLSWRFSGDGEMLRGDAPGDVLFRARSEEAP
jgi:hypothetical protein